MQNKSANQLQAHHNEFVVADSKKMKTTQVPSAKTNKLPTSKPTMKEQRKAASKPNRSRRAKYMYRRRRPVSAYQIITADADDHIAPTDVSNISTETFRHRAATFANSTPTSESNATRRKATFQVYAYVT